MAVNRAPKILDGCCRAVIATAALAVRREAGEVAVGSWSLGTFCKAWTNPPCRAARVTKLMTTRANNEWEPASATMEVVCRTIEFA